MFTEVKDSGKREEQGTGAVRDTQDGKPRYDLIPVMALRRLAVHYANGARKYSARNWEKGIPSSRCYSSALRHLFQYAEGDRSEDHLSAILFNVMAIIHWEETGYDQMLDMFWQKNISSPPLTLTPNVPRIGQPTTASPMPPIPEVWSHSGEIG
jgi:hypothetical protein